MADAGVNNGVEKPQSEAAQKLVNEKVRHFNALESARGNFESYWEDTARVVLPRYRDSFMSSPANQSKGDKRYFEMYDATASIAAERFASVVESLITPRNQRWHRLVATDPRLRDDRDTKLWFDEVTEILFQWRYSPRANFASNNYEVGLQVGVFGTGPMFIDEAQDARGMRYRALALGNTYLATNFEGVIDTAYRRFALTAEQAVGKFGEENLPRQVLDARQNAPTREFTFLHCVTPNAGYDASRRDAKGMRWSSAYIQMETKHLISEGGYRTFPVPSARYVTAPGEIYARGPAMLVLPAIKTLQEEKKTVLKQGQRVVSPVLLAADDGVLAGFSLRDGALNAGTMTKDGKRLVDVLPTGNIAAGFEMMNLERQTINDAFLVTLFQILVETPTMTATEVLERAREKGILLAPTMGRLQAEYLGPMIERELDILNQQGLLPEMPDALIEAGGQYEIVYDSPLSRAMRAEEAVGIVRSIEIASMYAQNSGDPSALDWFDPDVFVPAVADINAVPTKWMRGADMVEQIRGARAEAAEEQKLIEAAPSIAALAKTGAAA